jgi:hypothetical protein
MYVGKISSGESSCHTQEIDAITQKQLFITSGILEEDITIVEKELFEPPQE